MTRNAKEPGTRTAEFIIGGWYKPRVAHWLKRLNSKSRRRAGRRLTKEDA